MTHKAIYVPICGAFAALALAVFFVSIQRRVSAQSTGTAISDWITYNGNYSGDRFSSLQEITTSNVSGLQKLCEFDTGETTSFQTGPLAVSGTLYFTTYTKTYAVDGTTCQLKWTHDRPAPATPLNVNRGAAFADGRLFRGTGDAHVIAINATNGAQIWDVPIGDATRGESVALAPIAWNGLVFAGNAGGDDFGVTGRIYALSAV